ILAVGSIGVDVTYCQKQNAQRAEMGRKQTMLTRLALAVLFLSGAALAQEDSGPPAGKSPGWFLQKPAPRPAGSARQKGRANFASLNGAGVPACTHSPVCDPANGGSAAR